MEICPLNAAILHVRMSTDLDMHSVYYSMMLLDGTNYDSYFPCTPEGTNYPVRMREGVKHSVLSVCQFVCLSVCSVKNF